MILIKPYLQYWEIAGEEYAHGRGLSFNYKQRVSVSNSNDGVYVINYSPTVAGEYEMLVTMELSGGLVGTYYKAPDFDETHLLFQRADPVINMTFHESDITKEARNDLNVFSVEWNGFIRANHSEEYLIGIVCDVNGKASVTFNDEMIFEWNSCGEDRKSSILMKAFEKVKLRVRYSHNIDQNFDINEAFISLTWLSPSTGDFSIIPENNLYYERVVSDVMYKPIIYPNSVFAPKSTAIGESLKKAVAGEKHQFIVECRDEFGYETNDWGNLQFEGGSRVSIFARSLTTFDNDINFTVVDHNNGTYSVDYIPKMSGSYALYVFVSNSTINYNNANFESEGTELQVKDSPFNLRVLPGKTNASISHIENRLDTIEATAGEIKVIKVFSKDAYGNSREKGGDIIVAKVTSIDNGAFFFDCEVEDKNDGTYFVSILPRNHSGTHYLHINMLDEKGLSRSIMGSPFTLNVSPGHAFALQTHLLSGATVVGDSVWKFRTNSSKIRKFQVCL